MNTATTPRPTCDSCNDAPATRQYLHPWDQGPINLCSDCDPWGEPEACAEHPAGCGTRHNHRTNRSPRYTDAA